MCEYSVDRDGTKEYWVRGKLHRLDGPAVEQSDGTKYWYVNGKNHREDGPAVEIVNTVKIWYRKGNKHREDGPAVEWASGNVEYWVNDNRLTGIDLFIKFGVVND